MQHDGVRQFPGQRFTAVAVRFDKFDVQTLFESRRQSRADVTAAGDDDSARCLTECVETGEQ